MNTAMLDINKKIQKLINGPQTSGEKGTQAPEEEKGPQVSREKNLPFPNAKK
jgi:hypothetical protein